MNRTTLDIRIGNVTLEVEVTYEQGSQRRAYFGNGDPEDYHTPTTVDIESIEIIDGTVIDWTDYCASHPNVFEEIKILAEDSLDRKLAA